MKNDKKIKQILVDGQGWFYSTDCPIERFDVCGQGSYVDWYRQGNKEFNGAFVIEIDYEK